VRTALVWFRSDLRVADNPAMSAALEQSARVVPVYIHAPEEHGDWKPGAASRWWLHHSLAALDDTLRRLGGALVIRRGSAARALKALARETGAEAVFCNRVYEPALLARDRAVKDALEADGIEVREFSGNLLVEPWTARTRTGGPFRVFTPFWNAVRERCMTTMPLPAPDRVRVPEPLPPSEPLEALGLLPSVDWYGGLASAWRPGEAGAAARLQALCDETVDGYAAVRDRPDRSGTSRLSPHLHFGEISPRQVVRATEAAAQAGGRPGAADGVNAYVRQLAWREFAHHVLHHFPHSADAPLDGRFADFPWRRSHGELLEAWQRGRTGIPLVDAGMRELWHTGWMHNRARMVVASFLTKNCRIAWQEGARWFWDTLVDADLANNSLGWQWVAGCGADAAPYFRVFNPVLQGEKFDPDGTYVRRWVPELAGLPARWVHRPWAAPAAVHREAGLTLGVDYPPPVVDLKRSREEALAAFRANVARPANFRTSR
jgi:deoxyribodipyrimidine photo-lyase